MWAVCLVMKSESSYVQFADFLLWGLRAWEITLLHLGLPRLCGQEVDERQGEAGQEGLGSMEGVGLGVAPGATVA